MISASAEKPIFEPGSERLKREPIEFFKTQEKDKDTGEEYEQKWVSVMGIELPVYNPEREGGEGTKFEESEFKDYIIDDKSRVILRRLAKAIKLDHSPMIEGVTDIGKSKAIEYLSYLTNHKMFRMSVRGTTDPSEFFGKHVPESQTAQKKIIDYLRRKVGVSQIIKERLDKAEKEQRSLNFDDYRALAEIPAEELKGLAGPTRELFKKAYEEGRGLTKEEWAQLASLEGIDIGEKPFVWQDGELVKAMTGNNGKGYWFYVDEISTAEPQILVALNRVLEEKHRIELSEDGGRYVEAGPEFRLFASTNPPEYSGRVPLAPDFLRRWAYFKESTLDEKSLRARLDKVFVGVPLGDEIKDLFKDVLVNYHMAARAAIKTITAKQKQKFNYEFSDLLRVRNELRDFGHDQPLETLREAVEDTYFGKIGDEAQKDKQRKHFETLLATQKIEEKVKNILAERRPEVGLRSVDSSQNDLKDDLAALEKRLAT